MKIYLCARDDGLYGQWLAHCGQYDFVEATKQSILDIPAEGLVSPANSFGEMSGGIDLLYRNYFGKQTEDTLRKKIFDEFDGELLVGQATYVGINHPSYTYNTLIVAPTMRVPLIISHTINPYLAARAALRLAKKLKLNSITFPGLGTGTGMVPPSDCARQMAVAIEDVIVNPPTKVPGLYEEAQRMVDKIVPQEWLKIQYGKIKY